MVVEGAKHGQEEGCQKGDYEEDLQESEEVRLPQEGQVGLFRFFLTGQSILECPVFLPFF